MENNNQGGDISYHEPEQSGTTLFIALGFLSEWKQKEKSRRHIDNLELVDHWTMSGKTKIYVDKEGNHVPMDSIERDPPAKLEVEISEEDRAGLAAIIGGE